MTDPILYVCPKCDVRLTHEELKNNHMCCVNCSTPYVYTWRSL